MIEYYLHWLSMIKQKPLTMRLSTLHVPPFNNVVQLATHNMQAYKIVSIPSRPLMVVDTHKVINDHCNVSIYISSQHKFDLMYTVDMWAQLGVASVLHILNHNSMCWMKNFIAKSLPCFKFHFVTFTF